LYRSISPGVEIGPAMPTKQRDLLIMPAEMYRQLMDRPVRLQIDQYFTLLHTRTLPPLPVTGIEQPLAGVGRCAARVDGTGRAIMVGCVAAGELPACLSLELVVSGRPLYTYASQGSMCSRNYAPWRTHLGLDAISQSDMRLVDPRLPADTSELRRAQVIVTVREPFAHLVRSVIVPQVRLRDLTVLQLPEVP
jgi:hypothetical protein